MKHLCGFKIYLLFIIYSKKYILLRLSPFGIVSLIAGNLLNLDDLSNAVTVLFFYVITVLVGFTIHTIFTMPLLYFFLTQKNPIIIMRGMVQALVTAFGTASGYYVLFFLN